MHKNYYHQAEVLFEITILPAGNLHSGNLKPQAREPSLQDHFSDSQAITTHHVTN